MKDVYCFGLLGFDENGNICACKGVNKYKARSNFLYATAKANQILLNGEPFSYFFKDPLRAIMDEVENKGDFQIAKNSVVSNCLPIVQKCAKESKNDKEFLEAVVKCLPMDANDKEKLDKATNRLHAEYILTQMNGPVFDLLLKSNYDKVVSTKSAVFRGVLSYNRSAYYVEDMFVEKDVAKAAEEIANSDNAVAMEEQPVLLQQNEQSEMIFA